MSKEVPKAAERDAFAHIPNKTVYKLSAFILNHVLGDIKIQANQLPKGPAVYVPSHRSVLDIPAVGLSLYELKHEPVRFMAKRELYHRRLAAWWIHSCGGLPITRDQEQAKPGEFRPFIQAAKNGENVAVFGEGTRGEGPIIGPVFRGAISIAHAGKLPIVPVGIANTKPYARNEVTVVFGQPFTEEQSDGLWQQRDSGTEVLRAAIQAAYDEARDI